MNVTKMDGMKITYDPAKRDKTLAERGLDFENASSVFTGRIYEIEDTRKNYGERRIMCFGKLNGRMMVIGYVQRGEARHIFSMRKANDREIFRFGNKLG
ncbi:MAG: BrnT family toxin [Magnetococcus sp. YQC-5]